MNTALVLLKHTNTCTPLFCFLTHNSLLSWRSIPSAWLSLQLKYHYIMANRRLHGLMITGVSWGLPTCDAPGCSRTCTKAILSRWVRTSCWDVWGAAAQVSIEMLHGHELLMILAQLLPQTITTPLGNTVFTSGVLTNSGRLVQVLSPRSCLNECGWRLLGSTYVHAELGACLPKGVRPAWQCFIGLW